MVNRWLSSIGSALILAMVTVACATSSSATPSGNAGPAGVPATDQASDNVVPVSVTNNKLGGGTTTIYIEPSAGVRATLGTMDAGSTRTFSYRIDGQSRQVRLYAIDAQGQTVMSEMITIPRGAGLSWDLQINSVRVRR